MYITYQCFGVPANLYFCEAGIPTAKSCPIASRLGSNQASYLILSAPRFLLPVISVFRLFYLLRLVSCMLFQLVLRSVLF